MPFKSPEERREYLRQYHQKRKVGNSGIYRITCTANGRVYVGSAIDLKTREQLHRRGLIRGDHDNSKLQRAWNKYGESAFVWDVLEFVEPERLVEREQNFIDTLKASDRSLGFNLVPTASSMLGFKMPPEAIPKMRAAKVGKPQSPEHVAARVASRAGYKHSEETKAKIRESNLGKSRGPLSAEQREKQSAAMRGKRPKNLETLWTPEVVAKRVLKVCGQKRTPEQKARILAASLAGLQKRKEAIANGTAKPRKKRSDAGIKRSNSHLTGENT